jgi:hydrogenase maturation factor
MDRIPVFPETRRLSKILDFDPLGLIGSGSLLICCRKEGCDLLLSEIQRAGIAVCRIGEVLEEGRGVEAVKGGKKVDWPCFRVDELARILSGQHPGFAGCAVTVSLIFAGAYSGF